MAPHLPNGIDSLPSPATVSASTAIPLKRSVPDDNSTSPSLTHPDSQITSAINPTLSFYGDIPEGKRRKFVVINDIEKNNKGVRVKFDLNTVPVHEAPDSYRKLNSVYPRAWFPTQMQLSPGSRGGRGRYLRMRDEDVGEGEEDNGVTVCVKVPLLEGANGDTREEEARVPGLTRKVREKEEKLNDLGYRMSWSQSRSFANRVLFLQRGCE